MSTDITTKLIKELRDATGISVMQCKNALTEAEGDMKKALAILKKTSADIARKKADRATNDGRVAIKSGNGKAILMGLHCETDFVSKNEDFVALLESLITEAYEKGIDAMKEASGDKIAPVIQKVGENIELGDIYLIEGDSIGAYVHSDKSGVVVSLEGGDEELARDIAMHITAMKPEYMSEDEITDDARKLMKEIFEKEVAESDKPEEIKTKMLEGKLAGYFKEKTLTSQPFIKDSSLTIGKLLEQKSAKVKEVKKYSI